MAIGGLCFVSINCPYFGQLFYSRFYPGLPQPEPGRPDTIYIPSLSIQAPIIYPEEDEEDVLQEALQKGVVHYPGTAPPGWPGNMFLFGHSSDYLWAPGDYKTVFAALPQIKEGALVVISGHDGTRYAYRVSRKYVVSPGDLTPLETKEGYNLTLQTSYPLGTAWKRLIVESELLPAR